MVILELDEWLESKSHNKDAFSADIRVELTSVNPLKENNQIYQATLQIDRISYKKVMAKAKLFADYDLYSLYDVIEVKRCCKCNDFHLLA